MATPTFKQFDAACIVLFGKPDGYNAHVIAWHKYCWWKNFQININKVYDKVDKFY